MRKHFKGISGKPVNTITKAEDDSLTPAYVKKYLPPLAPGAKKQIPVSLQRSFNLKDVYMYDITDSKIGEYVGKISIDTYRQFKRIFPKGQIFRIVNEFGVGELTI